MKCSLDFASHAISNTTWVVWMCWFLSVPEWMMVLMSSEGGSTAGHTGSGSSTVYHRHRTRKCSDSETSNPSPRWKKNKKQYSAECINYYLIFLSITGPHYLIPSLTVSFQVPQSLWSELLHLTTKYFRVKERTVYDQFPYQYLFLIQQLLKSLHAKQILNGTYSSRHKHHLIYSTFYNIKMNCITTIYWTNAL